MSAHHRYDPRDPGLVRIDNWSTTRRTSSPYRAPETGAICVHGEVAPGHPARPEGGKITTSPIVGIRGRLVVTASGTRYLLGDPDPDFLRWLRDHGREYDPDEPIKDLR